MLNLVKIYLYKYIFKIIAVIIIILTYIIGIDQFVQ